MTSKLKTLIFLETYVAKFFVTIIIKYIVDVNDKYCIPSEVPSNK